VPWEPLPGSRRDAEPAQVADSLDRLVRHLGAPSVDVTTSLVRRWPDLVGPHVGANSRPLRLRDGTLTVGVADPAWATQLRFLEAMLVERLQAELGAGSVVTIEVRVRPDGLLDRPREPGGNAPDRR
jgi:predicted nucleic acid-binding Zn ribbon protein